MNLNKDTADAYFRDKTVTTMYNKRTYKVVEICWNETPKKTFLLKKGQIQKEITIEKYLYTHFDNLPPIRQKQPLLKIVLEKYKMVAAEGSDEKKKEPFYGYLVPELCRLSATKKSIEIQEENFKLSNTINKKIEDKVKISPRERKGREKELVRQLNESKIL